MHAHYFLTYFYTGAMIVSGSRKQFSCAVDMFRGQDACRLDLCVGAFTY